jgi:hypothetical protein
LIIVILGDVMELQCQLDCDAELIQKALQARFGIPWPDSRYSQLQVTIKRETYWGWRNFWVPPIDISFIVNVLKINGVNFEEMFFFNFSQPDVCRVPISMFYKKKEITKRVQVVKIYSRFDFSKNKEVVDKRNFIEFKHPIPKKYLIFEDEHSDILRDALSFECEVEVNTIVKE